MLNDLARNIVYFIEVALAKPLYAIVPALLTLVVGAYFIFSAPRTYYSEALLLMEFQQIPSTLVSPTVSGDDRLQFIEQRVLSRNNLLALAEKYDLFPHLSQVLPKNNFAGVVRGHINLQINVTEGPERVANNATVRLGFQYGDAALTTKVVEDLVSRLIAENRRIRTLRASETVNFLTREMNNLTERYRERDAAWTRYIDENSDAHPSRMPTLMIELQAKEQELATFDRMIVSLDEEVKLLEAQLQMGAEQASDTKRLQSEITAMEADIAAKSILYSDVHPQIRSMKQRVEELKVQATRALAAEAIAKTAPTEEQIKKLPSEFVLIAERIANAKPRQQQTIRQRADLAERIGKLRNIISRGPEVEAQLKAADAEKLSLQRSLDEMREKLDAARLGERLEEGDAALQIDVVEQPEIPKWPSGPRRFYLAIAMCVAASGMGLAGVYAAHLFDRSIRGTFDLARALEGQTLVVVPRWDPKTHASKALQYAAYANPRPRGS